MQGPPCQSVWTADAVFEASVTAIETQDGLLVPPRGRTYPEKRVHLTDLKRWIGDPSDTIVTGMGQGDCGYDFKVGQRYLISAYRRKDDGRLKTGICDITTPIERASALIAYLETLSRPVSGGWIGGRVHMQGGEADPRTAVKRTPLPGATIRLSGPVARVIASDAAGEFRFDALPPGEYRLTAEPPATSRGLRPFRDETVTLPNPHACAVTTFLTAVNGRIVGRLVDAAGQPLRRSLQLRLAELPAGTTPRYQSAYADEGGFFEFNSLGPGRYVFGLNLMTGPQRDAPYAIAYYARSSATSLASIPEAIALEEAGFYDAGTLVATPLRTRTLRGLVRWADGTPAARARVILMVPTDSGRLSSSASLDTDEEGRFRMDVFEGVRSSLRVFVANATRTDFDVPDDRSIVTITLRPRPRSQPS